MSSSEQRAFTPEQVEKPGLFRRLFIAVVFIGLGTGAIAIGIIAIIHRLSNFVVDNGVINGRILRLKSPISGELEAFYPRPGVSVQAGQVLARIGISHQGEQDLLQLEGEMKSKLNQLVAAEKSITFLQNRLQKQENEYERLWDVEVTIDTKEVKQRQAVLDKALAQAKAARSDYERFRDLYQQGAASQQQAEQAQATWETAEAEVRRAREELQSTQVALKAAQQRIAMNEYPNWGDSFVEETTQLRQQIQNQTILINTLKAEVAIAKERLTQAQSLYSDRQDAIIKAPLTAIVYSTQQEQGEFVEQSEELLSLLDCNDIWVEVIMSAEDAVKINAQKPVRVQLAGYSTPIKGEVGLIQAISSQGDYERSQRLQVQALLPTIDPKLVGLPLSRVTVKIPPPPSHQSPRNFCDLGRPARLTFATGT